MPISGATAASLTLAAVDGAAAGSYDVVVTNAAGSVTSSSVALLVQTSPTISVQLQSQVVLVGANVVLAVEAAGVPEPTYQWRKDGVAIDGATGASLDLGTVSLLSAGDYDVVVTNVVAAVISSVATVEIQKVPEFGVQPIGQTARVGATVTLSAVADGAPATTYQWSKDGNELVGVTSSSLVLTALALTDAGVYTVVASNVAGSATSGSATVSVVQLTAMQMASAGYRPGETVTVTNTISYVGTLSKLHWSTMPPDAVGADKWSYVSSSGEVGSTEPVAGGTDLLEWDWTSFPASSFSFSYTLTVPAGATGDQALTALVSTELSGITFDVVAVADPLVIKDAPSTHTADTDGDLKISLSELLRVIELYNTRKGTTRTGRYLVQPGTADGFGADPATAADAAVDLTRFHAADFNQDATLSLAELLRVIELYNYRELTTRTGEYHIQAGTDDGFAPGPGA